MGMPDHVDGGPRIRLQPVGGREGGPVQGYEEKRSEKPPDMFLTIQRLPYPHIAYYDVLTAAAGQP
jgi:hypothetical protein